MGNQSSDQENKPAKINHLKLQNSTLIQNNEIIKAILPLQNASDFKKWEQKLAQIKPFEDQVLFLPKKHSFSQKAYCGNSGFVQVQYDNHSLILEDEIKQRGEQSKYFQEKELWYLLYNLIIASQKFKKINSKVGDICPKNIFISESTGAVKVSNLCSWPCETSNYNKTIFDHQNTYLSPQEMIEAKQGRVQTKSDPFKAQSFTIGVTLLETAILKSAQPIYIEKKKNFNYNYLDELLSQLWKVNTAQNKNEYETYGSQIKILITALCEVNPETRISSDAVYDLLKSYDSQITNLKEFKPKIPSYQSLTGIPNKYYSPSTFNTHPQPLYSQRPTDIHQTQTQAQTQNYVQFQHKPENYHHFMTQQKNKFPIDYSEIKASNDSFKSSFLPQDQKLSIYEYSAPPTITYKVFNKPQKQFKTVNFSSTQKQKKYIPQYPITQIPKEELKKSFQLKTLYDQESRFVQKSQPSVQFDSRKNQDFLKRIDEQLKLSKQNYK